MITQICNFIFILSLVYFSVFIFNIIVKLKDNSPTPIKMDNIEKILLYMASSYIIYYIIY